MTKRVIKTTLALIIILGGVVIFNLYITDKTDLITNATGSINHANLRSLKTALELYNLDHNVYPQTADSRQMIEILYQDGYLHTKTLTISDYNYQCLDNGRNYTLTLP